MSKFQKGNKILIDGTEYEIVEVRETDYLLKSKTLTSPDSTIAHSISFIESRATLKILK